MYVTGLLQVCPRRQIIYKMKHCSRSSLNVLVLMSISLSPFFFLSFFHPFLSGSSLSLYTPRSFASWPLIPTNPGSHHDICPLKLLLKVVEGDI